MTIKQIIVGATIASGALAVMLHRVHRASDLAQAPSAVTKPVVRRTRTQNHRVACIRVPKKRKNSSSADETRLSSQKLY